RLSPRVTAGAPRASTGACSPSRSLPARRPERDSERASRRPLGGAGGDSLQRSETTDSPMRRAAGAPWGPAAEVRKPRAGCPLLRGATATLHPSPPVRSHTAAAPQPRVAQTVPARSAGHVRSSDQSSVAPFFL